MDYEVVWSDQALGEAEAAVQDLADINADAAEQLRRSLFAATGLLAQFPFIGPVYERDRSRRTREILCGHYRIFYRPNEDAKQVSVVKVWHTSRREPRLPPG